MPSHPMWPCSSNLLGMTHTDYGQKLPWKVPRKITLEAAVLSPSRFRAPRFSTLFEKVVRYPAEHQVNEWASF